MTQEIPGLAFDEPAGDAGDQASRLQMLEEQAAIQAALEGRVRGTDAHEDREAIIGASDDPQHGGGAAITDPEEPGTPVS